MDMAAPLQENTCSARLNNMYKPVEINRNYCCTGIHSCVH